MRIKMKGRNLNQAIIKEEERKWERRNTTEKERNKKYKERGEKRWNHEGKISIKDRK